MLQKTILHAKIVTEFIRYVPKALNGDIEFQFIKSRNNYKSNKNNVGSTKLLWNVPEI